jgi:hypothetical protein
MKARFSIAGALICCITISMSCKKDSDNETDSGADKFVIATRVPLNSTYLTKKWHIGTFRDLDIIDYTNANARYHPDDHWPLVETYKDFVFVLPSNSDHIMKKYKRRPDGSLSDESNMKIPEGAITSDMVIESDARGYLSLTHAGKIAVFNPSTMQIISYIDLTSYAKGGDGSPDPANLLLRNNKLYVACLQKMTAWPTSASPAEILIIDLANGNPITSVTDSRSTFAGNPLDPKSMFFDENGDLYVSCQASYGTQNDQDCGFLRIKNGQTNFDPTYFFNVADYNMVSIAGGRIRNFHHMQYAGNGIVYSTGNIQVLSYSNDFANKTFASFKVDLINKVITKLDLPLSNGYSGCVVAYQNKIYWGLATVDGVGIYSYDTAANVASVDPVITTEGDPVSFEAFE